MIFAYWDFHSVWFSLTDISFTYCNFFCLMGILPLSMIFAWHNFHLVKFSVMHTGQLIHQKESSKFLTDHVTAYFLTTGYSTKFSCCTCWLILFFKNTYDLLVTTYFFEIRWNSSSLTSITYILTPSTSNLVNVVVLTFIKRFPWRSNEIRGWGRWASISSPLSELSFVMDALIGRDINIWPIKRPVLYDGYLSIDSWLRYSSRVAGVTRLLFSMVTSCQPKLSTLTHSFTTIVAITAESAT